VRSMSPAEVLARLGDRFKLLRGGARRGLDRHRTLAATLDWSYSLLSGAERALLDRLAVFAGSFDLAAVERVCGEGLDDEVVDVVAGLVDKSMVVAERDPSGTRYRLLETVRHYSEGHLAAGEELARLRDRHLAHYLAVAETAQAGWEHDFTSGQVVFAREWDNLRAAIQRALAVADSDALAGLLQAVSAPALAGLRFEVLDWATQAAELPDARPATFAAAGTLAGLFGRFEECESFARAGIAAAATPDGPETEGCYGALYIGLARTGRFAPALDALAVAQRLAAAVGGDYIDGALSAVRALREALIDPPSAARWAGRAEALIASRQNPLVAAEVLNTLGRYYGLVGDPARGVEYCREALALAETHDLARHRIYSRNALAQLAAAGGLHDPLPAFRDAVAGAYADRAWYDLWPSLPILAAWWTSHDQPEAAAVIVGHLDAHHIASTDETTRTTLRSHPNADRWLAHGAQLDREQLVAYVLGQLPTEP